MKKLNLAKFLVFSMIVVFTQSSCGDASDEEVEKVDLSDLKLVWSDEFDSGTVPSKNNWTAEVWNPGKVNNEVQYYKDSEKNAYVSDGSLKIKAYKEDGNWYSARLKTEKLHSWKYGYFEAKIKMPAGKGVWPAFWMMPEDSKYGGWPRSGEIDIMEYSPSTTQSAVYSTVHHSTSASNQQADTYPSLGRKEIGDATTQWHTYGLLWTENYIKAIYDGKELDKIYYNPKRTEDNWVKWPYDQNFYIILNLAMGGVLGGAIDPALTEAIYEIDYVRVYQ